MKRTLLEQLDAFNRLIGFSNVPDNLAICQTSPGYMARLAALTLKKQSIITTDSQQEENNKGVTRTKKQVKTDMATVASAAASCLQGFASTKGDQNLYSLMQIELSNIMKAKDGIAIGKAKLVLGKCEGLPLNEIEPFGISQIVIDTIDQSIQDYEAVLSSTGNVKARKKSLTSNLTTLTDEANVIMRNQMLKIAKQWRSSHPDLYNGMVNSAKLIRVSIHTKARITVVDENDVAVADASIVITSADGSQLKGKTDSKGKCTISRVPDGEASMSIIKPNFIEKTIDGLNFQRGKSLTRKITLLPEFDVPAVGSQKLEVGSRKK
jgi:hypothetical protein